MGDKYKIHFVVEEIVSLCCDDFPFTCFGVGLLSHVLNVSSLLEMIRTSTFCTALRAGVVALRVEKTDTLGIGWKSDHRAMSTGANNDQISKCIFFIFQLSEQPQFLAA